MAKKGTKKVTPPPPVSISMQKAADAAIKADQELREGMEGITDAMRGGKVGKGWPETKVIRDLSKSVNEMADDGFELLYEHVELLVDMYPKRQQFVLALRCKNEGNDRIGRQALRNGLVDLE